MMKQIVSDCHFFNGLDCCYFKVVNFDNMLLVFSNVSLSLLFHLSSY